MQDGGIDWFDPEIAKANSQIVNQNPGGFNLGGFFKGLSFNNTPQKQEQWNSQYIPENNPVTQQYGKTKQQQDQMGNLGFNAVKMGLNAIVPGAGFALDASSMLSKSIMGNADASKYGIDAYKNYGADKQLAGTLDIKKNLGEALSFEKDKSTGRNLFEMATLGSANSLIYGKKDNQKKLDMIKELEGKEEYAQQLEQKKQGIFAKQGVKKMKFGAFEIEQVNGVPSHKSGKILTKGGTQIDATEKEGGGVIISFGTGEQKEDVLIENGEYVLKNNKGEVIAVFPEKTGKKLVNKEISLTEALNSVPDINDAETVNVPKKAQEGTKDEQEVEQQTPQFNIQQAPKKPRFGMEQLLNANTLFELAPLLKTYKAKHGLVNDDGYLKTSKNKKNPVNIIPSNIITTEGMEMPIVANGVTLYPDTGVYKFKESYVVETPLKKKATKAQKGLFYDPNYELNNSLVLPNIKNTIGYPKLNIDPTLTEEMLVNENGTEVNKTLPTYRRSLKLKTKTPAYFLPRLGKENTTTYTSEIPDIDWSDPDILAENNTNEYVKKITENYPNKTSPFNRATGKSQDFIDVNSVAGYALPIFNYIQASKSKVGTWNPYKMPTLIQKTLEDLEWQSKFGDAKGLSDTQKKIREQQLLARQGALNKGYSSYMATLAALNKNASESEQAGLETFGTKVRQNMFDKYKDYGSSVYTPQKQLEHQDHVNRFKDIQNQLNAIMKRKSDALSELTARADVRKKEGIEQGLQYSAMQNKFLENKLEYYLLYGTPEQKAYAQKVLANPEQYFHRPLPNTPEFSVKRKTSLFGKI